MSKAELPIAMRAPHAEDIPFIFNSWLHSYRHSIHVKNIGNTIYYGEHHKILERLFKRSEAVIACDPKDQNQIYGYIVFERITGVLVVHYLYVKQPYRRLGLCHKLLEAAGRKVESDGKPEPFVYTHETFLGNRISGRLCGMYNPYVYYQGYQNDAPVTSKEGSDESR